MEGMWEYVMVERMEKPSQTQGGLFLPSSEKDPYYVVRVVSVGTGVVGESGVTAPTLVRPRNTEWTGARMCLYQSSADTYYWAAPPLQCSEA